MRRGIRLLLLRGIRLLLREIWLLALDYRLVSHVTLSLACIHPG